MQGLQWEFAVIDEPGNVNAFVAPGGKVVFYTGLLRMLKTKDEVAAVLGHEAAHVVARHTVRPLPFQSDAYQQELHSYGEGCKHSIVPMLPRVFSCQARRCLQHCRWLQACWGGIHI